MMKPFFTFNLGIVLSVVLLTFGATDIYAATELPVVRISGGENHTLILGENTQAFACGRNGTESAYFGVLGTGDSGDDQELRLVHIHGPNDIGFIENISDISAGWMHSLARNSVVPYCNFCLYFITHLV